MLESSHSRYLASFTFSMRSTLKKMAIGTATYLPGRRTLWVGATGGTVSARYCYSVWMRHMYMAHHAGLNTQPRVVAELGPGDSLGIGIAALLAGAERCYAFDMVDHADLSRNLEVLYGLVELFRNREPIPGEDEFPEVKPRVEEYSFPAHIFSNERLDQALQPQRIARIVKSLEQPEAESMIQYKVPWLDGSVIEAGGVDLVYSQAVMEHVDDLRGAYQAMYRWLGDNGYISHQIDFKSHGTADTWNGHWTYRDITWRLIRGRSPYLINREPCSTHLKLCAEMGFEVVQKHLVNLESPHQAEQMAPRFRGMSAADLATSGAFIQALKKTQITDQAADE